MQYRYDHEIYVSKLGNINIYFILALFKKTKTNDTHSLI